MVRNGSNAVVWVALCNGQMSLWGRLFAESGEKECVLALLLQYMHNICKIVILSHVQWYISTATKPLSGG